MVELFLTFFKIGLFSFGGGYGMLSMIEDICVNKKNWITHDEMMEVTVIAESTPGPIAINCATFVGFKNLRWKGAISATFGVILPSFIIIYLISNFLQNVLAYTIVKKALFGISITVGILILNAAFNMVKKMKKTWMSVSIFSISCVALLVIHYFSLSISTIYLMVLSGILYIVMFYVQNKQSIDEGNEK